MSFMRFVRLCAAAVVTCAAMGVGQPAHATVHQFQFLATGGQEVPENQSGGSAACTVLLDDVARTVTVDCTYSHLLGVSTDAHIHAGAMGATGPAFVTLNHASASSGACTGFAMLQPAQMQAILNGNTYINIHSTAYPDGEIRGQIVNPIPPLPLFYFGLLHAVTPNVTLSQDSGGLHVKNIGSSGNDGVSIHLGGFQGWHAEIDFGTAGALPPGAVFSSTGKEVDTAWESVSFSETGGGNTAVSVDPGEVAPLSIEVTLYRDGAVIDKVTHAGSAIPPVLATGPIGAIGAEGMRIEKLRRHNTMFSSISNVMKCVLNDDRPVALVGSPLGPMDADALDIEVLYDDEGMAGTNPLYEEEELRFANTGTMHIKSEGIVHRDLAARALGAAHLFGEEHCPGAPAQCIDALALEIFRDSDHEGLAFRKLLDRGEAGDNVGLITSIVPAALADGASITMCIEGSTNDGGPLVQLCGSATGDSGGGLNIEIADSSTGADQVRATILHNGVEVASAVGPASGIIARNVLLAGSGTPRVSDFGMARHMAGEHMPGFSWKCEDDCLISLFYSPPQIGDEVLVTVESPVVLKKEEGGRHTPFHNKYRPVTGSSTLLITDVQPYEPTFTSGHVFGLLHTAVGGAQLSIRDFSSIDNAPEEKERGLVVSARGGGGGGGGGGGVTVQCVDSDFLKLNMEDIDLAGLDSELIVTVRGNTPLAAYGRDVYVWKVKKAAAAKGTPEGSVEIDASFAACGSTHFTLSLYDAAGTLLEEISGIPNSTPLVASAMPSLAHHHGRLVDGESQPLVDPSPALVLKWNGVVDIPVASTARAVEIAVLSADDPTTVLPLGEVNLAMSGELTQFTIMDEEFGYLGAAHVAKGAARPVPNLPPIPGMCPSLAATDSPAIITSRRGDRIGLVGFGSYSASRSVSTMAIVPDPCAGLPPNCIDWPDGVMVWRAYVAESSALAAEATVSDKFAQVRGFKVDIDGLSGVALEPDFSLLLGTSYTIEVLDGGTVVATLPNQTGPVQVLARGGNNENWPFGSTWLAEGPRCECTMGWDSLRQFRLPDQSVHIGDGLRLWDDGLATALEGIAYTELEVQNIGGVQITDMVFEEPIQAPQCAGDVAPGLGDGVVGIADLLAVIGAWGACARPCTPPSSSATCPADVNDDCAVGIADLLAVIGAWGACP